MNTPCFGSGTGLPRKGIWVSVMMGSLLAASVPDAAAGEVNLSSPDGRIHVSIRLPAPGTVERPRWSARFGARPILTECALGLHTADAGDLMLGARVLHQSSRSWDERVAVLFGKSDPANDRFHETRFTLETPRHHRTDVVFRCYDDAIALRYELPAASARWRESPTVLVGKPQLRAISRMESWF